MPRLFVPAAVAALGLLLVSATSASADPPVVTHIQGTNWHIEHEIDSCLDVPFPIRHDITYNAHLKDHVRNGVYFFAFNAQFKSVYTNLDNGKSLTALARTRDADQRIVDNGDGTITVTVSAQRHESYHSSDGRLVAKKVSNQEVTVVLEHAGTLDDPSDDVFVSETWSEPNGVDTLAGRIDCDIAAEFLA
ncbi:hypothetical protein N801_19855 [Knoellia aerolata DSM 18566]|uniref:Uncharacterized protein n=1 Tax=Knoellia aerolata DSM 18566 TaxID=1385519 RepID=A0A0A0JNA5_9MICO|nr:hypothetical protein N801_19855 [Knoellia aerolata DSM 18566]